MALLIGDNFSYNGKKPNFERDSFETLAILKAFPEANIDSGHIAYCIETNKHYIFNDSNSDDPLTGKWRELESEFSNLIDSSDLEAYLTKDEAQSTYQPIGDYVLKSEIPSLDGYATEVWVNSQGFLKSIPEEYITESELTAKDYATKSEIPDISNLASKDEIPTKVSQLENDSNYLTSVPDNYVTDTELQEAISGVQFELPIASDTVLGGIKIGAGLAINPDTGVLSTTGGGIADAVDWANVTSKPQINGHDLVSGNNTLASLGIQPAGNYALKSEIPSLNGYATESWVSSQGYLTSIPSEYITEDELNSKGYLTSVPNNYVTDDELTEAINDAKYTLPIASTDTLGGIKIGAGLTISAETGVLSATGGGVADAVNWDNVIGRPTSLSQFTNDSGFITNDDLPDLSNYALKSEIPDLTDYALKSEIPTVPTNVSSFINDSGYITNSALSDYAKKSEIPDVSNLATKAEVNAKQDALISGENIKTINGTSLLGSGNIIIESSGGGSEIMDVLDNKTYARTQGSWVDLTDWLTWAEYD